MNSMRERVGEVFFFGGVGEGLHEVLGEVLGERPGQ